MPQPVKKATPAKPKQRMPRIRPIAQEVSNALMSLRFLDTAGYEPGAHAAVERFTQEAKAFLKATGYRPKNSSDSYVVYDPK